MAIRRVLVFQQSNRLVAIYNLSKLRNGWLPCREWGEDEQHKQTWLEMGLPEDSRAALQSSISHLQGDSVFHSRRHRLFHQRRLLAKNPHSTLIETIDAIRQSKRLPNTACVVRRDMSEQWLTQFFSALGAPRCIHEFYSQRPWQILQRYHFNTLNAGNSI